MSFALENSSLSFSIDLPSGCWSLRAREFDGAVIENARLGAHYRVGRAARVWNGIMRAAPAPLALTRASAHGALQLLKLDVSAAPELELTLEFALPRAPFRL